MVAARRRAHPAACAAYAVLLLCLCLLAGCGGDGEAGAGGPTTGEPPPGGGPPPGGVSGAPVADAGNDQTVSVGALVILDGSGSTASPSGGLIYDWSFDTMPAGSSVVLEDPASVNPHFVPDLPGEYVAVLMVREGTVEGDPAHVTVTALMPDGDPTDDPGGIATPPGPRTGVCQPGFDPERDALMFVWRGAGGTWHVRAFAGQGPTVRYSGRITSASGSALPVVLEDPITTREQVVEEGGVIRFDLDVRAGSYAGFAFDAAEDGELSFDLESPAAETAALRLGPLRSPVAHRFRMDHTGDCGAPLAGGQPAASPGDLLALWREDLGDGPRDRWQVRAGGTTRHVGSFTADQPFDAVSPAAGATAPVLDAGMPLRIGFELMPAADAASGFRFDIAKGAHPCLALDEPATDPVLVGPNRFPMLPPFDIATLGECPPRPDPTDPSTYNYVIIFTDDQRWDTIGTDVMPLFRERLEAHGGVDFRNSYVTTPLCCPARSTIYSGGLYAHRTGYLANTGPNGNVDMFRDDRTLARLLQARGYSTMFIGKYFSTYAGAIYERSSPYVPPGWTKFLGRSSWTTDPQGWSNFRYTEGSSRDTATVGQAARVGQYTMDYERNRVLEFIDDARERPFFVFVATSAPHSPATPHPDDAGRFRDFVYNSPAHNADVSDKPRWVAQWPAKGNVLSQAFVRKQLDTLQSVDRAVAEIIDRLEELELLDRTIFVFTSDNGFVWGEHGLWGKGMAYESSVRVPLAVIAPQHTRLVEDESLIAANLDIGATVADFAGIDLTAGGTQHGSDGLSLRPLLEQTNAAWPRENLYIENFGPQVDMYGLWTAVVQHRGRERWKFIEHGNGEEELYDLAADADELQNLNGVVDYDTKRSELRTLVEGTGRWRSPPSQAT